MKDITEVSNGDLVLTDTVLMKATNLLSTQLASLEYAPDFGVDFRFFIESNLQFQNESFKAYLVERLTQNQINVSDVLERMEALYQQFTFHVDDSANSDAKGFVK
jgi:hypothetical protein